MRRKAVAIRWLGSETDYGWDVGLREPFARQIEEFSSTHLRIHPFNNP